MRKTLLIQSLLMKAGINDKMGQGFDPRDHLRK